MYDIECPYCGFEQEINHDDGYGYRENEAHEQECPECEKIFVYYTTISYDYDVYKAPCKNGGEHKLKKIHGYPEEYYKYKRRCEYCDETIILDEEKNKESIENYIKKLNEYKNDTNKFI